MTGGAGFIGSAVVRHLIDDTAQQVVNADDETTYLRWKFRFSGECYTQMKYSFEQVDICDGAAVNNVFAKHQPDTVMHLAAESHVDRSIDGP